MPLITGTRLGPYEILSLLGAGGMGEVYKARDTRLDRTVAIKVLSEHASSDQQSRERFEREAKVISNLDHPHICALYDVGRHDGIDFLVMPFLEGETLAQRLTKGALPLEQVLRFGIETADALDKAHREGIIHRDLKPGNIMLTKSGTKLLDFGLAKLRPAAMAASSALSQAPTGASITSQGTILGTLYYMAPEQLEGKDADPRSDIFSFGAVLYEMTTGRRAFDGKSTASVIAAILEREPTPITTSQPLAPPLLDHVIKRCLAKEPDERWQTAGDVMRELRWAAEGAALPASAATTTVDPKGRGFRMSVLAATVGLVAGIILIWLIAGRFQNNRNNSSFDVTRSLLAVTPANYLQATSGEHSVSLGHPGRKTMALSPDGRMIVFSAAQGDNQQLYVRRLDQLVAQPIAGSEEGSSPFISPDGKWVGFWSKGALKKAPLGGEGPATIICETASVIFGASWGSDDIITFDQINGGLFQIGASGGSPKPITMLDSGKGEFSHRLPQILPGNKVMFTVTHSLLPTWEDTDVVVQSLATNERKVIVQGGADGFYVSTGHILYVRRGTLMAVPFSLDKLTATGGSAVVVSDLMQSANMPNNGMDSGAGQFSVSQSGSLAYVPGGVFSFPDRALVWVTRSGNIEPLPAPLRVYIYPRLSPDGKQVLFSTQGDRNVWIYDILRGTTTRLTTDGRSMAATWTLDGKRVIFGSSTTGAENLFWKPSDNSSAAERLATSQTNQRAGFVSSDGQVLFFTTAPQPGGSYDIWALPLSGDRQPHPVLNTRFEEQYPDLSPDGHWLAYASDESGRSEVYVQQYPGPGPKVPISTDGGSNPAWTKDGRELFYLAPVVSSGITQYRMMAVNVTTRPAFAAEKPHMLFQVPFGTAANVRGYDVSSDGQRFLMVQQKDRPALQPANIVLVQNWFEELKRRVPSR